MESVSSDVLSRQEPSFYLFKHKDIDGIQLPLKGSNRVKYTSFNVSTNYIALGTNAGGIHIFRRSSLRHSCFLNAKVFKQSDFSKIVDVGVTDVLFSPQEKLLAAALSSGHVAVWALNLDKRETSLLLKKTDEHKGSTVTCLCWNSASTKLFIGDSKGCLSGLDVSAGKIRRVQAIIKEGPAIVQLDYFDSKLLISTTKRCSYYHLENEQLVQIGTKPRDGFYGACFLQQQANEQSFIYCARPGARLWEVNSSGQVLSTQQYKKLLATTSSPVIGHLSGNEKGFADKCDTSNFPTLLVIRDHYLMTWTNENIVIIDPTRKDLVLWNNQLENIEKICCSRQEMYVFHAGGYLSRYSLLPPKECAAKLFVMGDWLQCSKVLISSKSQIIPVTSRDHVPDYVVRRVKEMLNDDLQHEAIVNELADLEEKLERLPTESMSEDLVLGASLFDESETRSLTSDIISNPDSESMLTVDSGAEDMEEAAKSGKKEKLTKLKSVFKDQLKEISLDTVLLAGAQAAGQMSLSSSFSFGAGGNVKPFSPSWAAKNLSKYDARSPSDSESSSSFSTSALSFERHESVASMEEVVSDPEERKGPIVFKEKKKKKMKIHTIDILSPLQPTDLIKMEKSKTIFNEDIEKTVASSKTANEKVTDTSEDVDVLPDATDDVHTHPRETKESILSRSVSARQEVVHKARKFLKRLAPDDKDTGAEEHTKAFGVKGAGSKGLSRNITSPLEIKSFVIISRETRKKLRECQKLYDPKALKSTLGDWIVYLEKANVAVNLVYPKNKETRDYYVTDVGKVLAPSVNADLTRFLEHDDVTTVAELATLCFKLKIYSSSSEYDPEIDDSDLTNEKLLKCDTCYRDHINLSIESLRVEKDEHSEQELRNDLRMIKFLCDNFQLLSYQALKRTVIADCLHHRDLLKNLLRCLDDFTDWDAVDDAMDTGDTKVALQLIKDSAEKYQKRLLRHVFRLYYLVPRDVAKLCAEIYPHIDPWEVVLVFLSSSTNLYSNCSDFLIYVTHLIQNSAKKRRKSFEVLDEMARSEDFLMLVYHSALILDDLGDNDVRCHCGWPRPGSHQTSFQYEELMIDIIMHFKESHDTKSLKKLIQISWNHGYWQGCVQLLVMVGYRREALEMSLQLGDVSLLDTVQLWGWLPNSLSEWMYGLKFLAEIFGISAPSKMPEKDIINKEKISDAETAAPTPISLGNDSDRDTSRDEDIDKKEVFETSKDESTATNENSRGKFETCGQDMKQNTDEDNVPECSHVTLRNSSLAIEPGDVELAIEYEEESTGLESGRVQPIRSSPNTENSMMTNDRQFQQHSCIKLNASPEHRNLHIDLKSYVLVMLQKLGAQRTLDIISRAQLQNVFMQEFYYKCILSSLLECHKSHLSHRILREVNDHMWSSHCATLAPQIYQMKEVEMLSSSKEELFSGKEPVKYYRKLEDAACHWGIDLPLASSSCCSCPLPLCEKLPGHTQGVTVFPCGHLYHSECNSNTYCVTCFHDKLQIPLTRMNIAE